MIKIISDKVCSRCEVFYKKLKDLGVTVEKVNIADYPEVVDMANTLLPIFKLGNTYLGFSSLIEMYKTNAEIVEHLETMNTVLETVQVSRNNLIEAGFKDIISESETNIMELKLTDKLSLRVSHFDPYFMSGDSIQLYNKETNTYSSTVLNLR